MNNIAEYALAAVSRSMSANQHDEIIGAGPKWACEKFGHYGHNSICCIDCTSNFMDRNDTNKGATK